MSVMKFIKNWLDRYLSHHEALTLLALLIAGLTIILTIGHILTPLFWAIGLAFLLQGIVNLLQRWGVPHSLAVAIVFLLFIGAMIGCLFFLLPLLWNQGANLVAELPAMITKGQALLLKLSQHYPDVFSEQQIQYWLQQLRNQMGNLGQWVLSFSLSSLTNLVTLVIYLVLVPLLVFFFLKDKAFLLTTLASLLPEERPLMQQVWRETNQQIARYVRGKVIEIIITGSTTFIAFAVLGLEYAALLGLLVGVSVVIPYIGATLVTIPVALIAYFQWGWGSEFITLMVVYGIIQALDGNVLVPLLFSGAVNLHPSAIVIAILFFGGLWGFWGIFFAIPLAGLIRTLFNAWPRNNPQIE